MDLSTALNRELAERYSITAEIGRGGMATIFRATDLRHDRAVAVKVLDPVIAAAVGADRFAREIDIAAHLAHVAYAGRVDEQGRIVPRYRITMATGLDEETCRRVNLGYLDHRTFHCDALSTDPDTLIVKDAGRDLYQVD